LRVAKTALLCVVREDDANQAWDVFVDRLDKAGAYRIEVANGKNPLKPEIRHC
jgi:hypothetical protein